MDVVGRKKIDQLLVVFAIILVTRARLLSVACGMCKALKFMLPDFTFYKSARISNFCIGCILQQLSKKWTSIDRRKFDWLWMLSAVFSRVYSKSFMHVIYGTYCVWSQMVALLAGCRLNITHIWERVLRALMLLSVAKDESASIVALLPKSCDLRHFLTLFANSWLY